MNLLVIGGGGREHAIITFFRKNKRIEKIYALPGNAGIGEIATNVDISATDIDGILDFASTHEIDFAFVSPDDPLVLGAVDRLSTLNIPCFGPNKNAAIIEGSKVFSKNLMKKYSIPTSDFEVFSSYDSALEYIEKKDCFPIVIKADGLSLGKGVTIAKSLKEAEDALKLMMKDRIFGSSGDTIVIEDYMTGKEVSVLCFTDGNVVKPMISAMDHKPIYDGNEGPNTGGMGAIAPNPYYTKDIEARCMEEIFIPTMHAMNCEGRRFKGCIYFGLMLTAMGPKVVEYNCRFGDPEAQVVLPLLESDFFEVVEAVALSKLAEVDVSFSDRYACCVVATSEGYPGRYETGKPITFEGEVLNLNEDSYIFHAATKMEEQRLVTAGGRVLGVTALGPSKEEAQQKAYNLMKGIHFDGIYYRKDIGMI